MPSNLYNTGLSRILNRNIDFKNRSIKLLLVSEDYTFDKDHEYVDDITDEVTNNEGSGYERKSLDNKSISLDSGNDRVIFDADDIEYEKIDTNEKISAAILFQDSGSDEDSPVIAAIDLPDILTNGSDITLEVDKDRGVFTFINEIE